jgi:glucans biosynthesis protein
LDSKRIAGAFQFDIAPGPSLVMDVEAALYPRAKIQRLGIAPLTSMFLCGEDDRRVSGDWRPEIHDSDGLYLWTGKGERIFRPLSNPESVRVNAFLDEAPKGFGLVQRDLDFDHYQDDGAFYDRRPSAWVEPRSGFDVGEIDLVELPAQDETGDNIVAFWCSKEGVLPGRELLYGYRLTWGTRVPSRGPWGRVVATRTGMGGVVGRPRRYFSHRFVVDFAGDWLRNVGREAIVTPVITASRGSVEITSARPLRPISGYRAMFDLKLDDQDAGPVDLRLYLREGDRALTETWLFQWTPPPKSARNPTR